MSEMRAAFAESGHGAPRQHARQRRAVVSCWRCHHRAILSADPWPDHVPVPTFGLHTVAMPIATIVMSNHMDPGPFSFVQA
jgi:hypothetical protein